MTTQENKKTILVMDDEEMVGEIACQMLEYLGFATALATDGADAIQQFRKHQDDGTPFAAVILDLSIPGGMGGKEAVGEILSLDREAKVFVSSGYSNDPIMVDPKAYGFSGTIAKPFDLASIQHALASLL